MRSAPLVALVLVAACADEQVATRTQALDAYCEASVDVVGQGPTTLDVEADYLPHVVNCENGAADQAALEAQAVAARSYLYYRLSTGGSIGDGTGDQVYSCGREPGPQHVAAVEATSGMVLRYPDEDGTQVAAFYVAGAVQEGPACTDGASDPTNTERWVTYNEGKSGDEVTQTMLGFVSPTNYANRGCMSQNGGDCLAEQGYAFDDILRFYYGADIAIVQATGTCVIPPGPDLDADAGLGDDDPDDAGGGCAAGGGAGLAPILFVLLALRRRRRTA